MAETKESKGLGGFFKAGLALIVTAGILVGAIIAIAAFGNPRPLQIPEISLPPLGHKIPRTPGEVQDDSPPATDDNPGAGPLELLPETSKSLKEQLAQKQKEMERELRRKEIEKDHPLFAAAYPEFDLRYLHARVYERPDGKSRVIGYIRRGTIVRAKEAVPGPACPGGSWHPIEGGGYICSGLGYEVKETPPQMSHKQRKPDINKAVPFDYYMPKEQGLPMLTRLPELEELEIIERARDRNAQWPGNMLSRRMAGYFRLSGDRTFTVGDKTFLRTVQGHFVEMDDLEPVPDPEMRGVFLDELSTLPMAFVFEKSRKTYHLKGDELVEKGELPKHARFQVEKTFNIGKATYVSAPDGTVMERDHVRLAKKIDPPKIVKDGGKWVHVSLEEQTLVAYEGTEPVFVTLVSSGMKGFRTPRGIFQVDKKYITVTMSGANPEPYRVEDVPWTLYYWDGYAIHGAYWHDDFGIARSHGCTNVSPPDAKWLYEWVEPEVPEKWQGRIKTRGTVLYFTK